MRTLKSCCESLAPGDREVVARVAVGLNKQVGGDLGISDVTVKAHRWQVMRKMKAESSSDLVTMVAGLGLQPAPTHWASDARRVRHPYQGIANTIVQ